MTSAGKSPRKILLDTNCYLRLYCSPVLPLMQQVVQGYQLLTLEELGKELFASNRLKKDYPWVATDPKASDLKAGYLHLRGVSSTRVRQEKSILRPYARTILADYCAKQRLAATKSLSEPDITLLASALAFDAVIATDEWPLRLVVKSLLNDADEGDDYAIDLMSSLDILELLEQGGLLTREFRIQTVETWVRLNENLMRGWKADYERLFGEKAPVPD